VQRQILSSSAASGRRLSALVVLMRGCSAFPALLVLCERPVEEPEVSLNCSATV